MINVEQINIDIRIPSDEVCIVMLQPFVPKLNREPFKWPNSMINEQLNTIVHTLNLAQVGLDGSPAKFTLFPEYSIPGIAGSKVIDEKIISDAWPNENVIIAGIHGLTKNEYRDLCQSLDINVSPNNDPGSVQDKRWVNCCLIWVKDRHGEVHRWIQPKIRPSWPEMNVVCNDMFCGSTVYIFNCHYEPSGFPCKFVTFVCFDWIARIANFLQPVTMY